MTATAPSFSSSEESKRAISKIADAGGVGLVVVDLDANNWELPPGDGVVRVGISRAGPLPTSSLDAFDILLSADPDAPTPWVGLAPPRLDEALGLLTEVAARQPVAATVAAQVHRMTLKLSFEESLVLESLGYSMLLASETFKAWRAAMPVRVRENDDGPRVAMERVAGALSIRLTRPNVRNAVDARMRDALAEALEFALVDPDQAPVVLSGEGAAFSAGGDLDQFGEADDPGRAHAIRVLRYSAGLVHRLGGRASARLHGACVGAGIEIPAAATRVSARPGSLFRLPEVSMGLIPGAGGTASVPRRIGRQRACWMAISGANVDVDTALAWGLIDAVDDAPPDGGA